MKLRKAQLITGFCAKKRCTHRTYSYYCPTICFGSKEDWDRPSSFRLSAEKLENVRELLKKYIGTRSYHNFTSGKRQGASLGSATCPFFQNWSGRLTGFFNFCQIFRQVDRQVKKSSKKWTGLYLYRLDRFLPAQVEQVFTCTGSRQVVD